MSLFLMQNISLCTYLYYSQKYSFGICISDLKKMPKELAALEINHDVCTASQLIYPSLYLPLSYCTCRKGASVLPCPSARQSFDTIGQYS